MAHPSHYPKLHAQATCHRPNHAVTGIEIPMPSTVRSLKKVAVAFGPSTWSRLKNQTMRYPRFFLAMAVYIVLTIVLAIIPLSKTMSNKQVWTSHVMGSRRFRQVIAFHSAVSKKLDGKNWPPATFLLEFVWTHWIFLGKSNNDIGNCGI